MKNKTYLALFFMAFLVIGTSGIVMAKETEKKVNECPDFVYWRQIVNRIVSDAKDGTIDQDTLNRIAWRFRLAFAQARANGCIA